MQELIVNGVELNPREPLKERLVLEDPTRVQDWIDSFSAAKVLCVVSEEGKMQDAMERLGYQTRAIAPSSGLLCQEESAIWKSLSAVWVWLYGGAGDSGPHEGGRRRSSGPYREGAL